MLPFPSAFAQSIGDDDELARDGFERVIWKSTSAPLGYAIRTRSERPLTADFVEKPGVLGGLFSWWVWLQAFMVS
ncbi:hypothetical protein, partial [uncultured Paracoccus sp.]